MQKVARSIPADAELNYTMHEELRGVYYPLGWAATIKMNLRSLPPFSNGVVVTATMSSPLGYFCRLLQVVDN